MKRSEIKFTIKRRICSLLAVVDNEDFNNKMWKLDFLGKSKETSRKLEINKLFQIFKTKSGVTIQKKAFKLASYTYYNWREIYIL